MSDHININSMSVSQNGCSKWVRGIQEFLLINMAISQHTGQIIKNTPKLWRLKKTDNPHKQMTDIYKYLGMLQTLTINESDIKQSLHENNTRLCRQQYLPVNGLVAKSLDQHLKKLASDDWVKDQIQKSTLLDMACIVRHFLSKNHPKYLDYQYPPY